MEKLSSILLIEDDPTTAYLHKRLLQKFGVSHQIEIANSGDEALQLFDRYIQSGNEDKIPPLVLLDIDMPMMNGFEFLDVYQNLDFRKKDSVVIAILTSSFSRTDMQRAREYPVNDYIVKPLTEERMMEVMEEHFGWNLKKAPSK